MKEIFGSGKIRFRKLTGHAAKRRTRAATAERFYNYSVSNDDLLAEYNLRGDEGTYREDWGHGVVTQGKLTYASDDPLEIEGSTFNGHRYTGTEDLDEYYYFFGSEDLLGDGTGYAVGIFRDSSYDPENGSGWLGTRTDA